MTWWANPLPSYARMLRVSTGAPVITGFQLHAATVYVLSKAFNPQGPPVPRIWVLACRFITGAGGDGSAASGNTEARTLQAQIMHTYLPAVDVELSMQSGGSLEKSSECQFFIIQVGSAYSSAGPQPCTHSSACCTSQWHCMVKGASASMLFARVQSNILSFVSCCRPTWYLRVRQPWHWTTEGVLCMSLTSCPLCWAIL